MKSALQRRLLVEAPVWLVGIVTLAAMAMVLLDVTSDTGLRSPAPGRAVVTALTRVVMFGATAAVLAWRARRGDVERVVWRWLARAGGLAAAASAVAGGLDVARVYAMPVPGGLGAGVLGVGVLGACPLLYQGLILWNRHGTLTSHPGDWLNGVGAVLTLTALGGLLLPWLHSPLMQWPTWQVQLWLLRVAAEIMLLGTAATVLAIAALYKDVRAWTLTAALTLVVVVDTASAADTVSAAGDGPLGDVGWAALACALAATAVVRPSGALPRPVTTTAPTAGSFVVLIASITVLVTIGMVHHDGPIDESTARFAAAWAGLGALGVSIRGVQLIQVMAHLVISRQEALTDDLTGLANRRALDRALEDALSEQRRTGRPLALMLIDLDGFKQINDRFGHAVGDELLRRGAALLQRVSPPGAIPARLGGDEFAIILPDTSSDAALALFEILARAGETPVVIEGRRLMARASIGIATATAGDTSEKLLRHADAAMYRAKTAGGARVAVHDAAAAAADEQRTQLIEELKVLLHSADAADDLEAGRVVVHYQPQINAAGEVAGVEALVRWDHPRLGLLTPDRFLDLVEEFALMPDLTARVVRQAAAQAARWQQDGHRLRVSINLSASSLTHRELLPLVDEVLTQTGLDPGDLVLEVTETSLMADPYESIARLNELARRGVDISIDDYGSGYSSLAYLHDLPATELKLDRSLTEQVTTNVRTVDIIAGTVALAHRLGLRVVAEGVEDLTMLTTLRTLGCDETQGYLHARPMTAHDLTAWLTDSFMNTPSNLDQVTGTNR